LVHILILLEIGQSLGDESVSLKLLLGIILRYLLHLFLEFGLLFSGLVELLNETFLEFLGVDLSLRNLGLEELNVLLE
jgi:hypothetical protein